jgi:hypothetical protein
VTSSFFEFGRLARLGGRDGESRQSTEAIYLLPEHCRATQDPMAHLRMGGGMHRRILRVGPETDRYCAEIARAGDKTAVGRSSGLLLEFRARVNKPWEDLLVSCRSELMHPSASPRSCGPLHLQRPGQSPSLAPVEACGCPRAADQARVGHCSAVSSSNEQEFMQ